jgi:predicted anti-sigma-YlaC factor YlaD
MLSCQELTELVSAHLEGRLMLLERVQLQFHRCLCGDCREYVRQVALTRDSLAGLRELPLDESSTDTLRALFKRARGGE